MPNLRQMQLPSHATLLIFLVLIFIPFVAMINISFKDMIQFDHNPWGITRPFHFENYSAVWVLIAEYLRNTMLYAVSICIGVLALSSISAFVFARFSFPGRDIIYMMIILILMVPHVVTLVPQFVLVKNLGLLNSYWAMILPSVATGQVFGIFLLRSFFQTLPEELFEAARVDGASSPQVFLFLGLPLSKPILGTLAVINVLGTWNNLVSVASKPLRIYKVSKRPWIWLNRISISIPSTASLSPVSCGRTGAA